MRQGMGIRIAIGILGVLAMMVVMPMSGFGEVPQKISYQGFLTDDLGNPVSNDDYVMVFSIYDVATGGAALWWEEQTVTVTNGIYNVLIGKDPIGNPFPNDLFDDQRWLGVTVGTDAEMTPRQPLTSVPYALQAGGTSAGAVTAIMLADEAVTETKVATGAITADKIVGGTGSGVDADLLDGQSAEDFLGVNGGTVAGLLNLEGISGPQLVIHDSGSIAERPGVQFTGNYIHFIAGDDLSDEYFGFYSGYSSTRNYDAKLRIHGQATGNWGRFIEVTHNGTDGTVGTDSGDIVLSPAGDVRLATGKGVVYPDGSRQTTAYTASLEARVTSLESELAALKTLLANITRTGNDIHFNGVNVHVNNGTGSTTGAVNGLGNLIVGYNETRASGNVRSGSHNLIVGQQNNYSSFGGIVAGMTNTMSGVFATVTGGSGNVASGGYSSVSGGGANTASGAAASISGGSLNDATGDWSSVTGGEDNTASGLRSSVTGGYRNTASYTDTWAGGGYVNTASGSYASVSGGRENTASGYGASVSGGRFNKASGNYAAIAGGGGDVSSDGNYAYGNYSAVSGGRDNTVGESGSTTLGLQATISGGAGNDAKGTAASVSGGYINHADGSHSSISGGRYSTASGEYASVSGGRANVASGTESSVSGGENNEASGLRASVTGGHQNIASNIDASVTGGQLNSATHGYSSVTGGRENQAMEYWTSISGGYQRSVNHQFDWRAGDLWSDQ